MLQKLMQSIWMTECFLQIHLLKLSRCCIAWSKQQETLVSIWIWIKTKFMCFKQDVIFSLNCKSLKLVDHFIYLNCNTSSTEKDVNVYIDKAQSSVDNLFTIWKSDLSSESVLLYDCITWTQTKHFTQWCYLPFSTIPGCNTLQNIRCTATFLPSHKPSK